MNVDLPGLGVLTTLYDGDIQQVPVLLYLHKQWGPEDAVNFIVPPPTEFIPRQVKAGECSLGDMKSQTHYTYAREIVLHWFRSYHARHEADCGLGAPRGKLMWVYHCPACERIMDAIDAWLAPVGLRIDRGTLEAVDALREPKS